MSGKPAGRLGDMSWAVRMNPALPSVLPAQLRRAADDHPLPLSCGPARSRVKWRRPPCPSKAAASAWPCPAARGSGECRREPGRGRREAGCPAGSQHLSGGCAGPCSTLRGDKGSPLLAALLRPELSAFPPPGPTGCGWETRSARFFAGSVGKPSAAAGSPRAPRGARMVVSRRHGWSHSGLPPGWCLGAFMCISGFTVQ